MVVDVFFFDEAGLCITFTESTESITDACDLSSQGVSVVSDGLTLGDTEVFGVCLSSCYFFHE